MPSPELGDGHGPTAASSTPGRTLRRYTARAGKPNTGRCHGASVEDVKRQEALCAAQTDSEPVFGIIKSALGFRQFLLRGLDKVRDEWSLVTMAWNIKRMFTLSPA
jgi:hypothetical protein